MTEPGGSEPRRDVGTQFQQRMEAFGRDAQAAGERSGREAQAAGERFGREAQATGERLSRDPELVAAGTWFGRFIGLVLIVLGLWFFGVVSLGLDLPAFRWDVVWPALLIVLGGLVLLSAVLRRR